MTTDNDRYVVRATAGATIADISPERAGWSYSGLQVVEIAPGERRGWELEGQEAIVLPLRGGVRLDVGAGGERVEAVLAGRPDVFAGPSDFAYLPAGSGVTLSVDPGATSASRIALATSRADRPRPLRVVPADQVRVDLRGGGSCSRRVNNYTIATEVEIDRLLVCEVVTPGGNWSSYPPHKHDEHTGDERVLEEIYYFEVAEGPAGPDGARAPGVGYHRTYGTAERPIDVLTEVRTGDTALVPHGYHGPCMAAPGYDLYYLNVMAGPADDGRWMSTDDPAIGWIRTTWNDQEIDPRLLTPPGADARPAPGTENEEQA